MDSPPLQRHSRPTTPPSPSPDSILPPYDSNSPSRTTHRRNHSQDKKDNHPQSPLLPFSSKENDSFRKVTPPKTTIITIRILLILILISLFSWFYLEALAGGDIEWVKDNLSMLGFNLAMSVLCLTVAMTLIVLTPMSRSFAGLLFVGMAIIIYALKKWDDGESFEAHGAYNMLVFLVAAIPLNGLIQSILACRQRMEPRKFNRLMTINVVGTVIVTTLMLVYYQSIWGNGANGAHLMHGELDGTRLCEWHGLNLPLVDLLPNHVQNFWAGSSTCPAVEGIEAEWALDGTLTIQCLRKGPGSADIQPTYDILPDTRPWPAADKVMHTYNKKIVERIIQRPYTGPVLVEEEGIESIVANCEEGVSKVLIRLIRQSVVVDRVEAIEKARKEVEESVSDETTLVDTLLDEKPAAPARKPNVLVLFMDAVARRQFYRKLAQTTSTLASLDKSDQGGPQLHEFFRYHAVGFNTDANSRSVYTNYLDKQDPPAPPIWKDFYNAGYITSRVEDNCEDWSTQYTDAATSQNFDHELQSPFCLPPYYPLVGNPFGNFDGPYSIVRRCLHGTNVHNYAFEYMNQFRKQYPDRPWFQMGSFIEGHEGTGEVLLTIDQDLSKFMKGMEEDGTLENTIVFMLADHGLHMGINFMFTQNGRIEHMNPYLSVILPPLVTKSYPSLAKGLKHNQQSLVTGFEIHATLKMLANGLMPGSGDEDEVDGGAWRKGTLFDEELDHARTCEQAKVPAEFCFCSVPN